MHTYTDKDATPEFTYERYVGYPLGTTKRKRGRWPNVEETGKNSTKTQGACKSKNNQHWAKRHKPSV